MMRWARFGPRALSLTGVIYTCSFTLILVFPRESNLDWSWETKSAYYGMSLSFLWCREQEVETNLQLFVFLRLPPATSPRSRLLFNPSIWLWSSHETNHMQQGRGVGGGQGGIILSGAFHFPFTAPLSVTELKEVSERVSHKIKIAKVLWLLEWLQKSSVCGGRKGLKRGEKEGRRGEDAAINMRKKWEM